MYVCMYMYVCVCMVYVCICVCMVYVCMCVCMMYVCMHACICHHALLLFLQIPSIDDPPAMPNRGPQSGGTNITIRGRYLGIGSSHNVTIASHDCRIHEIM